MMNRYFPLFLVLILISSCSRPMRDVPRLERRPYYRPDALVVIDAGHGGNDLGTHSDQNPSYQEKDYTLTTAHLLKRYLEELGIPTLMIRTNDTFVPLKERARMANAERGSIFVSLHYNSAPNEQAHGIEIFYYETKKKSRRTKESKLLAEIVLRELLEQTTAKSRGVKHGNLAVIRETKMPAILVEGGFLTNADERKNLFKSNYLKKIALGIAYGIDDYLA